MSATVTVTVDGQTFAGELRPSSPSAEADLIARFRLDEHGFITCRGPHYWILQPPVPNRGPSWKCLWCREKKGEYV